MRRTIDLNNGKRVWVESFTGTVLETKAWSETSVSSTQNVGYVHSSGVMVGGGTSVKSKTTEKREVWLRSADGVEKCFSFQNLALQTRAGHLMTVVRGGNSEDATDSYLSIHLHTTDESFNFVEQKTQDVLYNVGVFSRALFALRLFIYIGLTCFFVGVIVAPVSATIVYFLRKPVLSDFKAKFASPLPSLLPAPATSQPIEHHEPLKNLNNATA